MRASSARLPFSSVRLSQLTFPADRALLGRTRALFVHLDHLIAFAKHDRDGRVDAYLAAYLPDEVLLFFFDGGELVNAVGINSEGRGPVVVSEGLRRVRAEQERSELCYATAPLQQLTWMYAACAGRADQRPVDPSNPPGFFAALSDERFSGVVEFISDGRVNYLLFSDGRFVTGYFSDRPPEMPVGRYMESLFAPLPDGAAPELSVAVLPELDRIPVQASAAQVAAYREVHQRIGAAVEAEWPGEGRRRSDRTSVALARDEPALGTLLEGQANTPVSAEALTQALARWVRTLLDEVELVAPGAATRIVREATYEHRYMLQAAGFYDRLPWRVEW